MLRNSAIRWKRYQQAPRTTGISDGTQCFTNTRSAQRASSMEHYVVQTRRACDGYILRNAPCYDTVAGGALKAKQRNKIHAMVVLEVGLLGAHEEPQVALLPYCYGATTR